MPRQLIWSVVQGVIILAILSAIFVYEASVGMQEDKLRALIFTSLVLMNISLILINRSFKSSLIEAFLKPNKSLWILVGSVITLLAIALSWQPARSLLHFGELHFSDIAICLISSLFSLLILEIVKSKWMVADHNSSRSIS
jgi:Ca2+-transporting ATPase